MEAASLATVMDNKGINLADSEIGNELMEAGDADARGQRGALM